MLEVLIENWSSPVKFDAMVKLEGLRAQYLIAKEIDWVYQVLRDIYQEMPAG